MPTAFKPQKRSRGRPPALILCGLLIIALRLAMPSASAPTPDLPASDEPAGAFPLPLEEVLPLSESAALPADEAVPTISAPVFTADGYHSAGTVYFKNETDYAIDIAALLKKGQPGYFGQRRRAGAHHAHPRHRGLYPKPGAFLYRFRRIPHHR